MERFGKRDLYAIGAEGYEPGVVFQDSRVVNTPAYLEETAGGILVPRPASSRHLYKSIALTVTLTPKSDFGAQFLRWGVLVGEIVHNLYSALDNLVWELAQACEAQWPPAPSPTDSGSVRRAYRRHWLELGFPYTVKSSDWAANCLRYLYFVPDPAVRGVLEKAQTFYAQQNFETDPDSFSLEVVHRLWNRDKHRTVNLATTGLQFQVVRINIPDFFPEETSLPTTVLNVFPLRPIVGKTEMAAVLVHFPEEREFPQEQFFDVTVNVDPKFTLAILFGDDTPGEGLNVLDVLMNARDIAVETIDAFS